MANVFNAFKGWKIILLLLLAASVSAGGTLLATFWVQAGPNAASRIIAENSTMQAVPAGGELTIAVLREAYRTDCITTTSRFITRRDKFALPPNMQKAAPNMPKTVDLDVSYPLYSGTIPGAQIGLGITAFGLLIPSNIPPGHYKYGAVIRTVCPLAPSRTSTHTTPVSPETEFDVLPPVPGTQAATQVNANNEASVKRQR